MPSVPHAPDPLVGLLLSLAIILVASKVGAHLAIRIGQSPVLGELAAGVLLGNLGPLGAARLEGLKTDAAVGLFAELGVVMLLFQVGLESSVREMRRLGRIAALTALAGIAGSFLCGWAVASLLLPDAGPRARLFIAAALTATSIGITARVLKELDRLRAPEAPIILGAAIVDDVIGLVMLTAITAMLTAASGNAAGPSTAAIAVVFAKAVIFLVGALVIGVSLSPALLSLALRLKTSGVLLAAGLVLCFSVAWLATVVGLAPIIGAFAAGLMLEDLDSRTFMNHGERTLQELVEPIVSFLAPVFFVVVGLRTNLAVFARPAALGLALALTAAAIAGKLCCGLAVPGRRFDRLTVALAMIPRGEVSLIFASAGLGLAEGGFPIVSTETFSAIVVMVIATTVITPPALKWRFGRPTASSHGPRTLP
jgi:Kef-type K+ transport system membrane component KefB